MNEQDINQGSCKSTCENLGPEYPISCDSSDHWCPSHPCDGVAYDCVSGGNTMEVCELVRYLF